MYPRAALRSSGFDISLLGVIVVGIGRFLDRVERSAGTMPHLIRFFDKPPGTAYPAVAPQDKALLLLNDPETTSSTAISAGETAVSFGSLPAVLTYLGIGLILLGPLWAWTKRR